MLKGFKNAAELDFTIDENKVKMEEAFQLVEKEKGSVFPHLHWKSGIQPHADGAGKGKAHHVYEGAGRGYGRDLCQIRRGL